LSLAPLLAREAAVQPQDRLLHALKIRICVQLRAQGRGLARRPLRAQRRRRPL
jgi:hypothetical protein